MYVPKQLIQRIAACWVLGCANTRHQIMKEAQHYEGKFSISGSLGERPLFTSMNDMLKSYCKRYSSSGVEYVDG